MSSFFFQNIGKLKTNRHFNGYQRIKLAKSFHSKPYPRDNEIHQLAKSLNISVVRIRKFYRGERYKKKQAGLPLPGEECWTNIKLAMSGMHQWLTFFTILFYFDYSNQSKTYKYHLLQEMDLEHLCKCSEPVWRTLKRGLKRCLTCLFLEWTTLFSRQS